MPDMLTRVNGFWHYVRRVPEEYATYDKRVLVRVSTKIRVADDPKAIIAGSVARTLNEDHEKFWLGLSRGAVDAATAEYHAARKAATKLKISPAMASHEDRTFGEILARVTALEKRGSIADLPSFIATFDDVPKPAITFRQCAEQYYNAHNQGWKSNGYRKAFMATLKAYAFPFIGDTPVNQLSNGSGTDKVMLVLDPIWNKMPETADNVRSRIEMILDYAQAKGYREGSNPARWKHHLQKLLIPKSKVKKTKSFESLPYAELPAFMKKLRQMPSVAARALEFGILAGARPTEARLAMQSEIDKAAKLWRLPAERMKAEREHVVPLCETAMALIAKPSHDSPYLFPGERRPAMGHTVIRELLQKKMGYKTLTVHGFRATFSTWANNALGNNYPTAMVDFAIAHQVGNAVSRAYNREEMLEKRRQMMVDWERYCNSAS